MSTEGGNPPDEPQVSLRSATPVAVAVIPDVTVRPGTPTDVLTKEPARDSAVVRHVTRWRNTSAGRLIWTGALILAMLAAVAYAGWFYAPKAAIVTGAPSGVHSTAAIPPSADPESAQPLPTDDGTLNPTPDGPLPINTVHPGDLLAAWATPLATKLGIPVVALQAYAYAELTATHNKPACRLQWSTLAGIGKIESDHGRAGATLRPDGTSLPSIIGAPLDGQSGRMSIPDTDGGVLDTDRSWDRAVGPMQFIPSTWKQWGVDADGNGEIDINNIYDASLAAADYLCSSGRDLSTSEGWHAAVASYNAVDAYINDVFTAANDYGRRSRS